MLNDQRHVIFSQRNDSMVSKDIFKYSENFLEEILDNVIKLKDQNISNPKNNDYENKLKTIVGKNFSEEDFKDLYYLKEKK